MNTCSIVSCVNRVGGTICCASGVNRDALPRRRLVQWLAATAVVLATLAAQVPYAWGQTKPNVYSIVPGDLEKHEIQVTAQFNIEPSDTLELMMPVWSPGFYQVQDYAANVHDVEAYDKDGSKLNVTHPQENHWNVEAHGQNFVAFNYKLTCQNNFVTTDWVSPEYAVINGCATFVVPIDALAKPCKLSISLPTTWTACVSGMPSKSAKADDGTRYVQFKAPNYDILVDSPIIAGDVKTHAFTVNGVEHVWADLGANDDWNVDAAVANAQKIVAATDHFWGKLPYDRYVFLNVFRRGGGGLEHLNSTLLTATNRRGAASWGWASFVAHEYFHAINVKRLRPVELGPFDYEKAPHTESLWIAEGLTTYFGNLMVVRGGIGEAKDYLAAMSDFIGQLQNNPGRLKQSLKESSLQVLESGQSGVGRNDGTTISYYVKGPVVGFLLDAKIRKATGGQKSLDDVMRAAYKQYAGDHGYTEQQWRDVASSVAGIDLNDWFKQAVDSVGELDYSEMLDWYGLQFGGGDDPKTAWSMIPVDQPSPSQVEHLDCADASLRFNGQRKVIGRDKFFVKSVLL